MDGNHTHEVVADLEDVLEEDMLEDVELDEYIGLPEEDSYVVPQWALVAVLCSAVGLFASVTWFLARRREPATVIPLLDFGLP